MTPFNETPEFTTWLDELAEMPSTAISENLYGNDPQGIIRMANLKEYFRRIATISPDTMLIGEAPGYQGTRRTGVPFASEHIITGGMPEVSFLKTPMVLLAHTMIGSIKSTSTIMWRKISKYSKPPLFWAVYPLHPHQPSDTESNRTPTHKEVAALKPSSKAY